MSFVSAGDWPQALALFEAAYEQRAASAPRSRYNDLAHLLAAQVSVRTWHDTEASLTELTNEAGSFRSGRTTALLRRILRQIGSDPGSSILDLSEGLSVALDEAG
jgi:hypothetical protein